MSIVDRLQNIVKDKGTTFKQLERDCGLGNGTIRRWAQQSPRLDKLTKVADYLQISLDYLVYGDSQSSTANDNEDDVSLKHIKEKQSLLCDDIPLNEIEVDIIAMFRILPESLRKEAFDYIYFHYQRTVEQGKESIYSIYTKKSSEDGNSDQNSSGTA